MSEVLLWLAQFAYIIWPLLVITAVFYAVPGRGSMKALVRRIYSSLAVIWAVLFFSWLVTLFAGGKVRTIIPVEPLNTIIFLTGFVVFSLGSLARVLKLTPARLLNALAGIANARADLYASDEIRDLMKLEPYQFEALVAETYRRLGYQARTVGRTGDHGVDVEVRTKTGQRWIVQCKRYRDSVGEEYVRGLYGTLLHEQADRAVLVTSATITPPAAAWARGKPIDLIDGKKLLRMLEKARRKMRPNLLDRVTSSLRGIFNPALTPSGLKPANSQAVEIPEERLRMLNGSDKPGPAFPAVEEERPQAAGVPVTVQVNPKLNGKPIVSPASSAAVLDASSQSSLPAARPTDATRPLSFRRELPDPPLVQTLDKPEYPEPVCPVCRAVMVPRPPRPTDRPGRKLYRCSNYPRCRVTLEGK